MATSIYKLMHACRDASDINLPVSMVQFCFVDVGNQSKSITDCVIFHPRFSPWKVAYSVWKPVYECNMNHVSLSYIELDKLR